MPEDKHTEIIAKLQKKAQEMEYGVLTVELKVHQGKFSAGEIIEKREKLG
jgi:hypothetical protein